MKKTARLLNQSSAGYKRRRTKFPIFLSSEIIPRKRFKEKRAAAKREIFKKFQQESQKACQDNLSFFSLCCINWCVGLHLCKTSILLQRSRERNSCQSENVVGPGDTQSGVSQEVTTNRIKGKFELHDTDEYHPGEPEESRSLEWIYASYPDFRLFFQCSSSRNQEMQMRVHTHLSRGICFQKTASSTNHGL